MKRIMIIGLVTKNQALGTILYIDLDGYVTTLGKQGHPYTRRFAELREADSLRKSFEDTFITVDSKFEIVDSFTGNSSTAILLFRSSKEMFNFQMMNIDSISSLLKDL